MLQQIEYQRTRLESYFDGLIVFPRWHALRKEVTQKERFQPLREPFDVCGGARRNIYDGCKKKTLVVG